MSKPVVGNGRGRNNWCTPEEVLEPVRLLADGRIYLDPCSNEESIVDAIHSFDEHDDGLSQSWSVAGLVYVNCPYSHVMPWVTKAVEENRENGAEIVLLLPASTGTRWFQDVLWPNADAFCFWRGRIRFLGAPNVATFDSVVVYLGHQAEVFRDEFRVYGRCF